MEMVFDVRGVRRGGSWRLRWWWAGGQRPAEPTAVTTEAAIGGKEEKEKKKCLVDIFPPLNLSLSLD